MGQAPTQWQGHFVTTGCLNMEANKLAESRKQHPEPSDEMVGDELQKVMGQSRRMMPPSLQHVATDHSGLEVEPEAMVACLTNPIGEARQV